MYPLISEDALTKNYTALGVTSGTHTPSLGEVRMDSKGNKYRFVYNSYSTVLATNYAVAYDLSAATVAATRYAVTKPATGNLHQFAGVPMSAIPTLGYGWIMVRGYCATISDLGHANQAIGVSLKLTSAQWYVTLDQVVDVQPSHFNHAIALEAYATASAADKIAFICCDNHL